MIQLNFPKYEFRFKSRENKALIFDIIRKKYVVLTPEEWVRQHCLHFLLKSKKYPSGLTLVERRLKVGDLDKRLDIAICNRVGKIELLVECKAPEIKSRLTIVLMDTSLIRFHTPLPRVLETSCTLRVSPSRT